MGSPPPQSSVTFLSRLPSQRAYLARIAQDTTSPSDVQGSRRAGDGRPSRARAALAALWLEHRTEVTLPVPTGPYAVGRVTYVWTDATPDTLAPVPGTRRELMVWIWYPTSLGNRRRPSMTTCRATCGWRSSTHSPR